MIRAYPAAVVRAAEAAAAATLPPGTLMARAAGGLAAACVQRLGRTYGARVVLLVGAGDNGADALWAGAQLARRGAVVHWLAVGRARAGGDDPALIALVAAGGRPGTVTDLATAQLVVDGMVGLGGRGALRPDAAALAGQLRDGDVVAVDLPSGVDADTGVVAGAAVRANLTVAFGCAKPGLLAGAGATYAGRVTVVDIGLEPWLEAAGVPARVEQLGPAEVARLLPAPGPDADKFRRGVLGIAAGSPRYTGAAVLATGAALRAGAGMVRFAGARPVAEQVRAHWPEAVVSEATGAAVTDVGRVQAWVVGPGLGTDDDAVATVAAVLGEPVPVLVDADALTICAAHPDWLRQRTAPTLLTPHDREFERFGRPAGPDRLAAAQRLAGDLGVTVLLKGSATAVADPEGPIRVNATGSPALATAGSGDVLSGGCGALLAAGLSPRDAGSVGAWLHGKAGARSADGAATSAGLILAAWPEAEREARR